MERLTRLYGPAVLCFLLFLPCGAATAAGLPAPGVNDARIRTITFRENDVTVIKVQQGVVTRVVLERDEKIEISVVGLSSDCNRDMDEWCISAVTGSNQIFIRPRDEARRNNMELHTNKRDYSLVFDVVDESRTQGKKDQHQAYFRVVFDYPKPRADAPNLSATDRSAAVDSLLRRVDASTSRPLPQTVDPDFGMTPTQRLKAEEIQVRNANYSKQVLTKGQDAEPAMVFDDGRFTYFEFPGTREIPAVFAHGSDGEPTRVNWHMHGNFVVVQRTAQKFTLRLGDAVVGIFNEAYDRTGIETPTSTVSPLVVREIKGVSR